MYAIYRKETHMSQNRRGRLAQTAYAIRTVQPAIICQTSYTIEWETARICAKLHESAKSRSIVRIFVPIENIWAEKSNQ